ncbi:MAG: hypothetical protein AB7U38_11355 [Hyphomicrobiales bacterium]
MLIAGLLAAALPDAGMADPAELVATLRARNAEVLKLDDWVPGEPSTAVLNPGSEGIEKTGPWRMGVGPMTVEIAMRKRKDGKETAQTPVLTLTVAGKVAGRITGEETYYDFPAFAAQIVEMDPSNPYPEVLFSSYTGGAHCCSVTSILTSTQDGRGWRVVEAGTFDGSPIRAEDADHDGRFEIAEWDNRFLYAFGCYACSNAPLKIERLADTRMVDVSRDPAFRERQRQHLKSMVQRATADMDVNSYLGGYVAQKILLGEGEEAIALMREHHDSSGGFDYESCTVSLDRDGNCKGEMQKLDFPEALMRFLKENGYN